MSKEVGFSVGGSRAVRWVLSCLLLGAPLVQAQNTGPRAFGVQPGVQLQSHVEAAPLAILPLGAMEYHGPSGPSLTDSIIAEGIARELASRLNASLFPVLSYTHCPAHTAFFQGSISVRPEVVTMLLSDVLRGLTANGFKKVLVLNAHNGNIGPAQSAISQVSGEQPQAQFLFVSWWETLPTPDVERLSLFTSGNGGHGHGGPLELSVAAFFLPASVKPGQGPDLPALEGEAAFPYYLEKKDTSGWPGYSGKLSEISPDKGGTLANMAVERIEELVKRWLADDSKPGSW